VKNQTFINQKQEYTKFHEVVESMLNNGVDKLSLVQQLEREVGTEVGIAVGIELGGREGDGVGIDVGAHGTIFT
jgi:hypothetical protein